MREFWDQRYGGEDLVYGEEPNAFIASIVDRLPAGRVLCIGEGEGRNAVYLASQGFAVTAIDLSEVGLDKARRLAARRGVAIETVRADLTEHAFGEGWSAIINVWCHMPSASRRVVHAKVAAALAPGGLYAIVHYTPAQLAFATGGPKDPDMLLTAEALRAELPTLTWLHLEEAVRVVHEGPLHGGESAVLWGLAQAP